MHISLSLYIYIYIYICREREGEKCTYSMYIYIYIYMYTSGRPCSAARRTVGTPAGGKRACGQFSKRSGDIWARPWELWTSQGCCEVWVSHCSGVWAPHIDRRVDKELETHRHSRQVSDDDLQRCREPYNTHAQGRNSGTTYRAWRDTMETQHMDLQHKGGVQCSTRPIKLSHICIPQYMTYNARPRNIFPARSFEANLHAKTFNDTWYAQLWTTPYIRHEHTLTNNNPQQWCVYSRLFHSWFNVEHAMCVYTYIYIYIYTHTRMYA